MELTGIDVQQQAAALQGSANDPESLRPNETVASKPVLGGENVTVRTMTDFEKLLAEFESKRKEDQLEFCKSMLSCALMIIAGRHNAFGEANEEVLRASEALTQASSAVTDAQNNCNQTRAEIEAAEASGQDTTLLRATLASQESELEAAQRELASAETALLGALGNLDSVQATDLFRMLNALARRLVAATREQPGQEEVEERATEIVKMLDAYAERIEDMTEDEIRKAVANLATDLVFLVTANYHVAPGDLPQYERRV